MNRRMIRGLPVFFALFVVLFVVSCHMEEESKPIIQPKFSRQQLFSKFSFDLGEATVDVSNYPPGIQESYKVFLAVCNSCHSSARPLNAPFVSAFDWRRFVHRMHLKMNDRGFNLDPKQEKSIIDFLVYDSKIRKIDKKDEFNSQQSKLQKLFDEVNQERDKLVLEETNKLPKKESLYVGVK